MNDRRLLLLADHLDENVRDDEFYLGEWKCGTTACAAGHACSIPELAEAGLRLVPLPWTENHLIVVFNDLEQTEGLEECFDLTEREADGLFLGSFWDVGDSSSWLDVTKSAVSAKIRELVGPDAVAAWERAKRVKELIVAQPTVQAEAVEKMAV